MLNQEQLLIIQDNYMNIPLILLLLSLLLLIAIIVYIINIELNKQRIYELILFREELLRKKRVLDYKRTQELRKGSDERKKY